MSFEDYTPPQFTYDLLAERSLVKIAVEGDPLALQLCRDLAGAFWSRQHAELVAVLIGMFADGQHVDPVTVMGQIVAQGKVAKLPGPWLATIIHGPGDHAGVVAYADQVREMHGRRRLRDITQRSLQRLESGWATGDDLAVRGALVEFRAACDELETSMVAPEADAGPLSMAEFLDGPTEEDWLVPGLLERGERMILTGGEGLGKSVACSQIGATMAGSVHPFSGSVLGRGDRGIRVTVLDCENSAVQSRRRYLRIIRQVDKIRMSAGLSRVDWKSQMFIEIRPEGMNLLDTRHVAHLEHVVASSSPDLMVIGPLYKIFNADPSDEPAVRQVAAVLDGLRTRHHFALLIEAHPGKGEGADGARRMSPIGSSLWQRWPEYGFGLRRAKGAKQRRAELVDVVSWRGSREERSWPEQLRHGSRLPWEPVSAAEQAVEALESGNDWWNK